MTLSAKHAPAIGSILILLFPLLLAAPAIQSAPRAAEPTMPLSEVQPGMAATVQTVFEGGAVEEFDAEIVGIMENYLGPDQDLILARLKGEKVEFTGVAAGMSGSPVYIGGKLIGALSYRIGNFMKEPIAGITPIEYMLSIPGATGVAVSSSGIARSTLSEGQAPAGLEPIETPLVASGVPASALEAFGSQLARFGLGKAMPGSAARDQADTMAPLRAGDAVAAQLVSGDISLALTGTVTRVDGDHVLAFGHPALLTGATRFPMARANIHLTLPSLEASTKVSRVLNTIGTFDQSRLSGISGLIGPTPRMIPVRVEVTGLGNGPRVVQSSIFEHRELTPLLVGVVTLSSLVNTSWSAGEMTLKLSGRIAMEGHEDVRIDDLYTSFSDAEPAGLSLARDVRDLFGAVYQNRFEQPSVRSVELNVSAVESPRLTIVEGIYPSRTELDAGEEVEFTILLRSYQGETSTRKFIYRVPETTPSGPLLAQVGSASSVAATERPVVARQVAQAGNLDELITLINRLRPTNALCLKINRRGAGAVVRSELLPALPPSVFSTLGVSQGRGEVTTLMETTIHEDSIPLDQIVVGGTSVLLRIR